MVVESHPRLDDGSPFPTTFWLTCPVLVRRIGSIEAEGWMSDFNDRLSADPSVEQRLGEAIDRYRAHRDRHEPIDDSGSPPGGGPDRIKCVHAHVAHELVQAKNPVGSAALAATGYPDCVVPCYSVVE